MAEIFRIYRSSAGSGKTRTLAKEYIKLSLRFPDYFKYILAVTFTNKSTQEMKDRIIQYLSDFTKGKSEDLAAELKHELNFTEDLLRERSQLVLSSILHQYGQFSISTIDAFFQKIIRSFTRESGLLGNFRLEIENERVLREVVDELMEELGTNHQLTEWVVEFSRNRLTEGHSWNIIDGLVKFSNEIFKEEFKSIEAALADREISDRQFLQLLRAKKEEYLDSMQAMGQQAMDVIQRNGFDVTDFSRGSLGTPYKLFDYASRRQRVTITATMQKAALSANGWAPANSKNKIRFTQVVESSLLPLLNDMLKFHEDNVKIIDTVEAILQDFYAFGLLQDITRKLHDYKAESNLMLLSDASRFLNGVISESDTPFIYEKVGSFYKHYLIDEFQDTSYLQWKNFQPLLRDALDQQNTSMVVGDVKQSIYRWRGGDLELLQNKVKFEVGKNRTGEIALDKNYRSAEHLVNFNNQLFTSAAKLVEGLTSHDLPSAAFIDVMQHPVKFKNEGYVEIQFIESWKNARQPYGDEEETEEGKEFALKQVPVIVERLQAKGIALRDIAILVRKNEEGQQVAAELMRYKNSPDAKPQYRYDVVSNESLRLDAASCVSVLVSALKYLENPHDAIARGELIYELMASGYSNDHSLANALMKAGSGELLGVVPERFYRERHSLVRLSLFELTETLIEIFSLGRDGDELAYLQAFQDIVLTFSNKEKNDAASFLDWWENNKKKESVQVAANTDAVGIYTIHKSKGLQFKYVVIPFCSWKLNHDLRPLMWCSTENTPFDQIKYVAVRYKSALEETYFATPYRTEFVKAHLDNLNVLYVALTRAEEGMIILAPKSESKDKILNAGQLLFQSIQQNSELSQYMDATKSIFRFGEIKKLTTTTKESAYHQRMLTSYNTHAWRNTLVIKRQGSEFFRDEVSEKRKRINYGILMHQALARIEYFDQVEDVVMQLNLEGIILEDEMEALQEKLNAMMKHPTIGGWFSKEWNVHTEIPILAKGDHDSRLDRVIHKVHPRHPLKRKAIIIDFKTGRPVQRDRDQVEHYASLLASMNYADVDAYLLYLNDLTVVQVVNKLTPNLF